MMLCVCVDFDIDPEAIEAFLRRVGQQAEESLETEAGCKVFEVWTSSDRPHMVHLYEVYDDADAFEIHMRSNHYQSFTADIVDMVADKTVTLWDRKV